MSTIGPFVPKPTFDLHIQRKLALAKALNAGECGGDYLDACLIVSALVNLIAADLWPGKGIDYFRFVETWVKYADPMLMPVKVSLPLLVRRLKKGGLLSEAQLVEALRPKAFGPGYASRVLYGDSDADEAEVLSACSSLTAEYVRRVTYPAIFYQHVRSPVVHEYHFGTRAAATPMTDQDETVSYVNLTVLTSNGPASQRRIHFHLPWLADVVTSIANQAYGDLAAGSLAEPAQWWTRG